MHTVSMPRIESPTRSGVSRYLAELIFGFGFILLILWVPEPWQRILSPIALACTLAVVLSGRVTIYKGKESDGTASTDPDAHPGADDLGLGLRGLASSLWILPAAALLTVAGALVAREFGTLHPLYKGDFKHIAGYVMWTLYQQFLLQNYFMPRLLRVVPSEAAAVLITAFLFATAHLPNLSLTLATLLWGVVSCLLFLRYRNIYALGLAQGMLGLAFAICVPDMWHHHLRVGLGYLRYHSTQVVR